MNPLNNRYSQTYEAVQLISSSNADIRIFGGDINALPFLGKRQPYRLLSNIMTDAMIEKYPGRQPLNLFFLIVYKASCVFLLVSKLIQT